jgi:hypothetical protein
MYIAEEPADKSVGSWFTEGAEINRKIANIERDCRTHSFTFILSCA